MAHNNTVLAQFLKLVSRHEFERDAAQHHKGRKLRKMTRRSQFVAMFMAQLSGRSSLRDIVANLATHPHKLYHLGVGSVTRSSLARVNEAQPYRLYERMFERVLARCQRSAPGHGFRFKSKLYSLDASTVDLCLSMFPWAKFKQTKGAVKLHVGIDHGGYLPTFVRITDGKRSDIEAARVLEVPRGSLVVADRAYVDFAWLKHLNTQGISLVTRMKKGIRYAVRERRAVKPRQGLTSDQIIVLTSTHGTKRYPGALRRIGYRDAETGKHYVFLTNNFDLSAKTIADIYKARWQIELFFKWIKQHLKVKSFVGTSRNAVLTQLWIAMCVYLLLSYIKFVNRLSWSLYEILRVLQLNLFDRRAMMDLLETQSTPPDPPPQLRLKFT